MYNCNLAGWRHNEHETLLSCENASQLELKWMYPADGSNQTVRVVHTTPSVVDGEVYFGTVTFPAFYKLAKDGSLLSVFRNPNQKTEVPPTKGATIYR